MASDDQPREIVSARRNWQGQDSDGGAPARTSRRRFRLLVLTGGLSTLVTTLVVLAFYLGAPPPAPDFLAINVAEHNRKHFPVQAFAEADSELLLRHFEESKRKEATTKTKVLLCAELNGLKSRNAPALVIHITALALVRDDTVYLLPADAEPDNQATWLNVQEVLQAVEQCPARNKLLILDLAHGLVDPRLGVLTDRVAEALDAYFRKEEPSFPVLCPCAPGQFSLTSEVLRSSVFAFYLDQGLLGDADANKDGNISVQELFEYAEPRIDRWARCNRGARQQPILYGKQHGSHNFIVAPTGRPMPDKNSPSDPTPYPESLQQAWKKRDEAASRDAFRHAPRQMLQLEANLLRHESRWQAGVAGKEPFDQATRDLFRELESLKFAPDSSVKSLSLAGAKENQALTEIIYNVISRSTDSKNPSKELAKILENGKTGEYLPQALAVANALSRLPELKQEHLKTAQAILASFPNKERHVESLYVERLVAFADRKVLTTFREARVETIWRTMRDHETAVAALAQAPEFLAWVGPTIELADKKRRVAEGKLFWDSPTTWPGALRDLNSSQTSYVEVKKSLEGMQAGSAALHRAIIELPAHLRALAEGPDADPLAEDAWLKAAEEAAFIQAFFLAAPPSRNVADARLDTHGRDLQQHLDELMRMFRVRIKNTEKADTAKAQRQLHCLLQSPLLLAKERADLINALRTSAKKLHDATETAEQPASNAPTKNSGAMRGKMSVALLNLVGDALPSAPSAHAAQALEKSLHHSWGKDGLVKRWREAPHDRRGDALSRLVSPWDPAMMDEDHTRAWQMKVSEDHVHWLLAQYEAEARETNPKDQDLRDFYRSAALKLPIRLFDKE